MTFSKVEFQAVILAIEYESRLYPLTDSTPKALLPVGNRPLLSFQLELLSSAGFTESIVVVNQKDSIGVLRYIQEFYEGSVKVELVVAPEGYGSADALRHVSDLIHSDFVVMSGDLVTDVIIHYLADYHRVHDACVTVLMKERDRSMKINEKGTSTLPFKYSNMDNYVVALTRKENNLQFFRSVVDVEFDGKIVLPKHLLRAYGGINLRYDLQDGQCCVFSHWILDLLKELTDISSIQGELIPLLVSNQTSNDLSMFESVFPQNNQQTALEMSSSKYRDMLKQPLRCFALIAPPTSLCERVNSVAAYYDIGLKLPFASRSYATPWSKFTQENELVIDRRTVISLEGVVMGSNVQILNSTIGRHCVIGDDVVIENSIVQDHVKIEAEVYLSDSIVCEHAHLLKGAQISRSCIASSQTIAAESNCFEEVRSERVFEQV